MELFNIKDDVLLSLTECGKAQETITIPASVKCIAKSAFRGNENLKSVIFEKDSALECVGDSAFRDCVNLESIDLPESVKVVLILVLAIW